MFLIKLSLVSQTRLLYISLWFPRFRFRYNFRRDVIKNFYTHKVTNSSYYQYLLFDYMLDYINVRCLWTTEVHPDIQFVEVMIIYIVQFYSGMHVMSQNVTESSFSQSSRLFDILFLHSRNYPFVELGMCPCLWKCSQGFDINTNALKVVPSWKIFLECLIGYRSNKR